MPWQDVLGFPDRPFIPRSPASVNTDCLNFTPGMNPLCAAYLNHLYFLVRTRAGRHAENERRLICGSISRKANQDQNIFVVVKGWQGRKEATLPIRTVTHSGARVGPHRCPILQRGAGSVARSCQPIQTVPSVDAGNDRSSV
jgi:hypothetical protein